MTGVDQKKEMSQIKKSRISWKNFILSLNAPFFLQLEKAEESYAGQAVASEEKLTENSKNTRDSPESYWLMYSWKAPSEEEGTQTQLE